MNNIDEINKKLNEIVNKLNDIKDKGQMIIPDDNNLSSEDQEDFLKKLSDTLSVIGNDFNEQIKKIDIMMDEQDDIESKL